MKGGPLGAARQRLGQQVGQEVDHRGHLGRVEPVKCVAGGMNKACLLYTSFLVLAMHLALYLAVPLFPLFLVREIQLSDQFIGLGNSIFSVALFLSLIHI